MTLRDDLLPALDAARTICADLGLRQNAVDVIVRTWASGEIGVPETQIAGTDYADVSFRMAPNPKVRRMSAREVASSGGRYEESDLVVGPMTPAYGGGGYTIAQLDPEVTAEGVELIYVVTGPNAGEYALHEMRRDRPMRYEAVVRRTRRTP